MKLLILSQYFPPEAGAPQNRLYELAIRLQALGYEIEVLTAMPNYPQMEVYEHYRGKWSMTEQMNGMRVKRSFIYVSKRKSIVARLLNYFSFVCTSFFAGLRMKGDWDFILCESPPLFLGFSAVWLAKIKKTKLIFNVSDLWPESAEKLGIVTNKSLLNLAYKLEKWCYQNSVLVTGQTQGIVVSINQRFPEVSTYWLPNGVDLGFYNPEKSPAEWRQKNGFESTDLIIGYAGILGHAQGLELMVEAAEKLQDQIALKFVLVGEGPEKEKLQALILGKQLSNIRLFNGVAKAEMPAVVASFDVAFIPLRKLELFKGAIPSKIFENLAMKKPIVLGVDGEAKELFIDQGKCGWFYEPENLNALVNTLKQVQSEEAQFQEIGERARTYVSLHFERNNIAHALHNRLSEL